MIGKFFWGAPKHRFVSVSIQIRPEETLKLMLPRLCEKINDFAAEREWYLCYDVQSFVYPIGTKTVMLNYIFLSFMDVHFLFLQNFNNCRGCFYQAQCIAKLFCFVECSLFS